MGFCEMTDTFVEMIDTFVTLDIITVSLLSASENRVDFFDLNVIRPGTLAHEKS